MRLFITASYKAGQNRKEIERICNLTRQAGFVDFCFIRDVENYTKKFEDTKELMRRSREEIEKSDALLIDLSKKPTGRAFEAGIAYALGKKIIVIIKRGMEVKDTVRGIADLIIEYKNLNEILAPLKKFYAQN